MRTIELALYQFDELSEEAQQNAIDWYKHSQRHYVWLDEGIDSIKAFCKHYDISLKDYSISPYSHSYIDTDADNHHFRGITLKQVEKEKDLMPTGYCVDADLFNTMYESMKTNGGDALAAFKDAIDAGMKAIIADMEYQDSDEYAKETILANEYEFTEDGERA